MGGAEFLQKCYVPDWYVEAEHFLRLSSNNSHQRLAVFFIVEPQNLALVYQSFETLDLKHLWVFPMRR